jgi:predicted DNA-binding transcriptional regulator AlpA
MRQQMRGQIGPRISTKLSRPAIHSYHCETFCFSVNHGSAGLTKISHTLPDDLKTYRLIDRKQLKTLLPVSSMTVWRMERDGRIPKHFLIGRKAFWKLGDVLNYLQKVTQGGDSK